MLSRKEIKLKKRLETALQHAELDAYKQLLSQLCEELELNLEDCAAALMYLHQPDLFQQPPAKALVRPEAPRPVNLIKKVRYRLEVGSRHQAEIEEIEKVLVEESGVDKKQITRIDIRQNHTIVELPDGMPSDIFKLLTEAEINGQKLRIKRLKPQRRYRRFRR